MIGVNTMFLYWDGYEIDGSDTDFEIILPESVQVLEFVDCYLSMPIFCNVPKPEYLCCYNGSWHKNRDKSVNLETLRSKLLANDYEVITITLNCQHLDLLSKEIQSEIYGKGASRKSIDILNEPSEMEDDFDYTKAENPCLEPVVQTFFDRGGMTAQLSITNENNGTVLCLNVGPGAYFEYTMYILDYMRERFPSVKMDLEDGFSMSCCNFHPSSMYRYEKVIVPVKYNLNHTLKHLTEHGLMSFRMSHHKKYTPQINYKTNGFFAATHFWGFGENNAEYSFSDYYNLIEMTLAEEPNPALQMFTTSVNIIIPSPEVLAEEATLSVIPSIGREEVIGNICSRTGYMSFYYENETILCEFRIRSNMKEYFKTWLTKAELGMIDFIKPEMYKLRKEQDAQ